MAGTSGKQILPGWTRDSLPGPATRYSQDLVTCFESAWRERMWQLRSQEGIEHLNEAYMVAPKGSRVKSRGAECREANDLETEIWRGCQRSDTAGVWARMSVPARVYIVDRTHEILMSVSLRSQGYCDERNGSKSGGNGRK